MQRKKLAELQRQAQRRQGLGQTPVDLEMELQAAYAKQVR